MPAQLAFAGATRPPSTGPAEEAESKVSMNLLMPKIIRWKKPHKPPVKPFHHSTKWKFRGYATKCNKPHFGKYGLQVLDEAWISSKVIETVRRTIVRVMERKGKIWIRIFPNSGITQRVAESRMGAGKGSIDYWVAPVRPNVVIFEMDGVTEDIARNAFRKAAHQLPCRSRFMKKEDGPSQFELGLAGTAGKKGKRAWQRPS